MDSPLLQCLSALRRLPAECRSAAAAPLTVCDAWAADDQLVRTRRLLTQHVCSSSSSLLDPSEFQELWTTLPAGTGAARDECAVLVKVRRRGRCCGGLAFFCASEPRASPIQLIGKVDLWEDTNGVDWGSAMRAIREDDVLWVKGHPHRTNHGRLSIVAHSVRIVTSCSRPPNVVSAVPEHPTVQEDHRIVGTAEHSMEREVRRELRSAHVKQPQFRGGKVEFRWQQPLGELKELRMLERVWVCGLFVESTLLLADARHAMGECNALQRDICTEACARAVRLPDWGAVLATWLQLHSVPPSTQITISVTVHRKGALFASATTDDLRAATVKAMSSFGWNLSHTAADHEKGVTIQVQVTICYANTWQRLSKTCALPSST